MVRSMLKAKEMQNRFWGEAVLRAMYILNRCPTKKIVNKTNYEVWISLKPNVSHNVFQACTWEIVKEAR